MNFSVITIASYFLTLHVHELVETACGLGQCSRLLRCLADNQLACLVIIIIFNIVIMVTKLDNMLQDTACGPIIASRLHC